MSIESLRASLTAIWHVGVAYAVGSVADHLFGKMGKPANTTFLLLQTSGQLGAGFLVLTEIMGLLADVNSTPIGDGISTSVFIAAQPGLLKHLKEIKAALLPQAPAAGVTTGPVAPVQQSA